MGLFGRAPAPAPRAASGGAIPNSRFIPVSGSGALQKALSGALLPRRSQKRVAPPGSRRLYAKFAGPALRWAWVGGRAGRGRAEPPRRRTSSRRVWPYDYVMKTDGDTYLRVAALADELRSKPSDDMYLSYGMGAGHGVAGWGRGGGADARSPPSWEVKRAAPSASESVAAARRLALTVGGAGGCVFAADGVAAGESRPASGGEAGRPSLTPSPPGPANGEA
jgi:hypothetical protein